ncbi:tetratricopeptide repeat protein [Streptomyces sp. NPDC058374]|uniref:tetratricopeptide repeat protein n=1 Tax=Streptomyces sp. NPDC058374 TaxID=3346466 RepID=UPI00366A4C0F
MDRETGRPGTGLRTDRRTPLPGAVRTPRPRQPPGGPGAPPPPPARRPRRRGLRLLAAVGVGLLLAGGGVVAVDRLARDRAAVAPLTPAGRALAAAAAGRPAALGDLAALIGEREARVRRDPADRDAWAVLGAALAERAARSGAPGAHTEAERALQQALAGDGPADVRALTGLAVLAGARQDWAGAARWGEAARDRSPGRWTTYLVLLDAYRGAGNAKAADKALERLQELRPTPVAALAAAGAHRERGWREDAEATVYDAAARAATPAERAGALRRAGDLAWERGEAETALTRHEAALRAEPAHHPAAAGRARALAGLGRTEEALAAWARARALAPHPGYAVESGELLLALGRSGEAADHFSLARDQVAALARDGVRQEPLLGRLEADHGDPAEAVRLLTAEHRRHPGPAASDALGWALHRAGRSREALPRLRAAVKDGPNTALPAYHLGMAHLALGERGAARRQLERALRIAPEFSPLHAERTRRELAALGEPAWGPPPA